MKHLYHTTLFLVLLSSAAFAQQFKPNWVFNTGSFERDEGRGAYIDNSGNQYFTGGFTGTVDFNPGLGVWTLNSPYSDKMEAYLLKLDASNNFQWVKSVNNSAGGFQVGKRLAVDDSGNIYIAGSFYNSVQFVLGGTTWTSGVFNPQRPFLAKLNPQGVIIWGVAWYKPVEGTFFDIEKIELLDNGKVLLVGSHSGTTDFKPGLGIVSISSAGNHDMFMMVMEPTGTLDTVLTFGSTGEERLYDVRKKPNGDLILAGGFSGQVDFNPSPDTALVTSAGGMDGVELIFNQSLQLKKVRVFRGIGNVCLTAIAAKDSNYCYLGGYFNGTADIDPLPGVANNVTSVGLKDCFIVKLDSNDNYVWGIPFGGVGEDHIQSMDATIYGDVVAGGYYNNTVDFDPAANTDYYLTSKGHQDGFVAKFDSSGNFQNATSYGSSVLYSYDETINSVIVNANQEILTTGIFTGNIDVNPGSTTQNISSAGKSDILIMRLDACLNAFSPQSINVCGSSYTLPSGAVISQTGYYTDTVLSQQGCDSINAFTVTLNPLPNTAITQTGATFAAQAGLASYQWYNCQSMQPIAGETNPSFTATANGQYAVIVSNGTCTDTSACFVLDNIGLHEAQLPALSLYPNPTNGMLHMQCAQPWQKAEVLDITGRLVHTQNHATSAIDLSKLPAGMYVVKVYFEEGISVQRVVKE